MKVLVIAAVLVAVLGRPQEEDGGLEGLAQTETDLDNGQWKDDVSNNPVVMGTNPEAQGTANADNESQDQPGEERRKRSIADNDIFPDYSEDIGVLMETITVQDTFFSSNPLSTDMTRAPATPSLEFELDSMTSTTTPPPPPPPPPPISGFCRLLKRTYDYFCTAP